MKGLMNLIGIDESSMSEALKSFAELGETIRRIESKLDEVIQHQTDQITSGEKEEDAHE